MMKTTKELFSAAALMALLLGVCACGDSTGSVTGTEPTGTQAPDAAVTEAETEAVNPEEAQHPLPEKDMGGFPLRFYNYDESWLTWAIMQLDAEGETGDNVNDAIFRRNSRIEETNN